MAKSFKETLDLDSKAIRSERISTFLETAEANSEILINQKENQLRSLKLELKKLMDLNGDSSLSLAGSLTKTDTMDIMYKIHELHIQIKDMEEDLKTMRETHATLFPKVTE